MDIHKPKAAHSWREFLIEIGTITCGILIALSLEQVLEWQHWRERVEQAQEAMHHELADDDAPQAYARAAISPCLAQQLAVLKAAIKGKQSEARISAMASNYHPFSVTWDDGSWKAASASGVLAHFDRRTYDKWFSIFTPLAWFERDQAAEHELVDVLRNGLRRSRPITNDEADHAIRAVQGLERANHDTTVRAQYFLMRAAAVHGDFRETKRTVLANLRKVYGQCVIEPRSPEPSSAVFDIY